MHIASDEEASKKQWLEAYDRCDYATFFHSPAWIDAWEQASHGRILPRVRVVRFADDRRAILPLSMRKTCGGLVRYHECSVAGTYGGWISADEMHQEHVDAVIQHLTHKYSGLALRLNPFAPHAPSEFHGNADTTRALRLDAPLDALVAGWSKGHRAAVRQAQRAGVVVRNAQGPADWQAYDGMYRASINRWGESVTSKHPRELFEALSALDGSQVRLWLAEHRGVAVAGALCLYARKHVAYWHGAALEEAFPVRPVHLLIRVAVADAIERGCDWFDFNPSGGHTGVEAFKKSFGTQELATPWVRCKQPWGRVARRLTVSYGGGRDATRRR